MYSKSMNERREKNETSRGFIKIILLIVIGLILLGYFGVNLKDVLASPVVKENLSYAWNLAKELWAHWLRAPVVWVWDHLLKFLWDMFWNGVGDLKNGGGPQTLMQQ